LILELKLLRLISWLNNIAQKCFSMENLRMYIIFQVKKTLGS
jgi:hypothetical protein